MMSVPMRAAHAWAEQEDFRLRADDNRFNRFVYVVHEDGSMMFYQSAFVVRCPLDKNFVGIFTEHHGFFVEALDDLRVLHVLESVGLE